MNGITYGIDFTNGDMIITADWDVMAQHIATGNVTMIIVRQSGEILFDARDGWDIVTMSPPRT